MTKPELQIIKLLLLAVITIATVGVPVVFDVLGAPPKAQTETAQTPTQAVAGNRPEFDAASIKPSRAGSQGTYQRRQPGGLYTATNVNVRVLVASAYLDGFPPMTRLVLGGPGWIDSEHFDIEAKAEGDPSGDRENLMLQSLLADRFKLVVHHETRQLPVYALVLAKAGKTGPLLTPHSDDAKCADTASGKPLSPPGPGEAMPAYCGGFFMTAKPGDLRETGNKVTATMLAAQLVPSLDRTVVDRTGLSGDFDFTLEFAPDTGPGSQFRTNADASDPSAQQSIFTALQEQLGLKLESTTGPVDVLVIDHVEEPSAN
jgi:uncharacterized protein (TIGR03435 family)